MCHPDRPQDAPDNQDEIARLLEETRTAVPAAVIRHPRLPSQAELREVGERMEREQEERSRQREEEEFLRQIGYFKPSAIEGHWVCPSCAAIVHSREAHQLFHNRLQEVANQARSADMWNRPIG